jgi:hypothetical protein
MIGASDGFDLSNPNSDVLITVFGLVSRLFIKSLRENVKRGMKGGAERGNCLGKLSLGFTRRVKRDAKGNVVCRPDGQPRKEPCIDPDTKAHRVLLYAKIKKLVQRVEDEPDDGICAAYDQRIKELQKDLKPLEDRIRDAEQRNRKRRLKPLELKRAKEYLADLRGLLNQETPMAAEAIRTLTGPLKIRQESLVFIGISMSTVTSSVSRVICGGVTVILAPVVPTQRRMSRALFSMSVDVAPGRMPRRAPS